MKKTSTAIVLPSTQPKPRKEDILNALVERARVKHSKEAAVLQEKRAKALDACKEEARKLLDEQIKTLTPSFEMPWVGSTKKSIEVSFHVTSPKLERLIVAYNAVPSLRNFDAAAVKMRLRDTLGQSARVRVDALLCNPDAVKALDAMLEDAA